MQGVHGITPETSVRRSISPLLRPRTLNAPGIPSPGRAAPWRSAFRDPECACVRCHRDGAYRMVTFDARSPMRCSEVFLGTDLKLFRRIGPVGSVRSTKEQLIRGLLSTMVPVKQHRQNTHAGRSIAPWDDEPSGMDDSVPEPIVTGMQRRRVFADPENSTRRNSVY